MSKPLVSIIVPIYKVPEQYLRKCIESAIAQTVENIEILLVDDGSPDQCGEICDSYVTSDGRVKVIHKKTQLFTVIHKVFNIFHNTVENVFCKLIEIIM